MMLDRTVLMLVVLDRMLAICEFGEFGQALCDCDDFG